MNDLTSLDDYRWLTSDAGCAILVQSMADMRPVHRLATDLRKKLSISQVHLVLEQIELRRRATAKFEHAATMFFTRVGLEQATDQWIAAYKALRFGCKKSVADLCCGIGGDLLAIADRGPVVGVECDPRVAELAAANIGNCQGTNSDDHIIAVEQAEAFDITGVSAWHCDPDRRPGSRRTTQIDLHAPNATTIGRLLGENSNAAIKLAPASNAPEVWPGKEGVEWEWISRDRECRQLVAWFGNLAQTPGQHVATLVFSDSRPACTFVGTPDKKPEIRGAVGRYVFVPDPAIFAAKLDGALAIEHGLVRIGEPDSQPAGYLTGDDRVCNHLLSGFEVTDVLPLDAKRLARILHDRGVGTLEIKHRGVPMNPETFRGKLQLRGERSATMLATTAGNKAVAILALRLTSR